MECVTTFLGGVGPFVTLTSILPGVPGMTVGVNLGGAGGSGCGGVGTVMVLLPILATFFATGGIVTDGCVTFFSSS